MKKLSLNCEDLHGKNYDSIYKKIIIFGTLTLLGLMTFYFWLNREDGSSPIPQPEIIIDNASIEVSKSDPAKLKSIAPNTTEVVSSTLKLPELPDTERAKFLTAAATLQKNSVKNIFGYLEEDYAEYSSYSDDLLLSLIKNGDVKAINFMADKKLKEGNLQEAGLLYLDQSIRGGVGSIEKLSKISHELHKQSIKLCDKEDAEYHRIQEAAWTTVAVLRGIPEKWILDKIVSTDEVNNIANQHFAMLESERVKTGLGNFDADEVKGAITASEVILNLREKYRFPKPYDDLYQDDIKR